MFDRLEVLPKEISAKLAGGPLKYDKVKTFCETAIQNCVVSKLADGQGGSNDGQLKVAILIIEKLWNENAELREKIEEFRDRT